MRRVRPEGAKFSIYTFGMVVALSERQRRQKYPIAPIAANL
jgi:hypothetical protein